MNSSFKRNEIIPCNKSFQSTLQKQMSQLLEVKNALNPKLILLTKNIEKDISNFVTKNYPHQNSKFSLIDIEFNLFGTTSTFLEFSTQYTSLSNSLQADIKGVVQVLQNFSATRPLSLFITQGVLDNLLKLNKLMLYRQQHCQKLMKQLQQNILNNKPMHSMTYQQSQLCSNCRAHIQHQNIIQAKQMIQYGGQKVYNYYRKNIQRRIGTDSDQDEKGRNSIGSFYDRIMQSKNNLRRTIGCLDDDELLTHESLKYTLDKLQSNLQHRKYDILGCLIQMGQFGTQVRKSFSKNSKNSLQKTKVEISPQNTIQQIKKRLQMPQVTRLVPKFNYEKFTFDVGKHFCKEIKQIETQISQIKNKYSDLLVQQMSKIESKETQCNLIKDSYDIQLQKHNKKAQKKISLLYGRINELEQTNKQLRVRLQESTQITKKTLAQKLDHDKLEVEKKAVEMTMQKIVDKYQTKLKEQQKELKQLKKKEFSSKNKLKELSNQKDQVAEKIPSSVSISPLNSGQLPSNLQFEDPSNKEDENAAPNKKAQNKKKISMFLQPILRRRNQRQNPSMSGAHSVTSSTFENNSSLCNQMNNKFDKKRVSMDLPEVHKPMLNSNPTSQMEITQLTIENYVDSTCQMTSSVQVNPTNDKTSNQEISSKNLIQRKKALTSNGQCKLSMNHKLISVVILPNTKKIRESSQATNIKKLPELKSKNQTKNKLMKAKSYQDSQFMKSQLNITDQVTSTKQKNLNASNNKPQANQQMKRYISEHSTYLKSGGKQANSIRKNFKDGPSRKIQKTLSLTTIKKEQTQGNESINGNNNGNQVKLPSLSHYQKSNININSSGQLHTKQAKSSQKLKSQQKAQRLLNPLTNKNALKKKRKRRNFSQEQFGMDFVFGENMGNSINDISSTTNKIKKKEYIIDFIPKVEEQSIVKVKEEYSQILQAQLQGLFGMGGEGNHQADQRKSPQKGYQNVQKNAQIFDDNSHENIELAINAHNSQTQAIANKKRVGKTFLIIKTQSTEKSREGLGQQDFSKKNNSNKMSSQKLMIMGNKSPFGMNSPQVTTRLNNNQIALSTKLYSALAQIKSSNLTLYKLIRQKLYQQYKKDHINQVYQEEEGQAGASLNYHGAISTGRAHHNSIENEKLQRLGGSVANIPSVNAHNPQNIHKGHNYISATVSPSPYHMINHNQKKGVKTNCDSRVGTKSIQSNISQSNDQCVNNNKSQRSPKNMPLSILSIQKASIHDPNKQVQQKQLSHAQKQETVKMNKFINFHTNQTNGNQDEANVDNSNTDREHRYQSKQSQQQKQVKASKRSKGKQGKQLKQDEKCNKQVDEKQLRMIINSLIAKHRNNACCSNEASIESQDRMMIRNRQVEDNKQNKNTYEESSGRNLTNNSSKQWCKHLSQFFMFLNGCRNMN